MLHIHAAVAEKERARIAQRTKEALAAAKARGVKLGDPDIGRRKAAAADALAESLREVVAPLAGQAVRAIARALNDRGVKDGARRAVAISAGDTVVGAAWVVMCRTYFVWWLQLT